MALLTLAAFSVGAHATSLGEIEASSHLGEPLKARIAVRLDSDVAPDDACLSLAGASRQHPELRDVTLEFVTRGSRRYISLSTTGPVNDPMLDISVRMEGCGPSMQKDFLLMLSPVHVEAVVVPARAVAMPIPADNAGKTDGAKPPIEKPDQDKATEAVKPAPRPMRAASSSFILKLDYDDGAFGALAERIAQRKQAAHLANNRKPAVGTRASATVPATAPALQAKVERAAPVETVPAPRTQTPVSAPATPAMQEAPPANDRLVLEPVPENLMPPVASEGGNTAAGAPEKPGDDAMTGRSLGPETGAASSGLSTPNWRSWFSTLAGWLPLLLLLLVILLLALWLKRRKPAKQYPVRSDTLDLERLQSSDELTSPHIPRPPVTDVPAQLAEDHPPVDEVFVEPPEAKTILQEVFQTRPRQNDVDPLEFKTEFGALPVRSDGLSVEQHDSFDHVMELAEVMLAFGRSGQAIETLSQHIRDNPRQSVDPWLKLLELYHQSDLRTEFEALSADLHKYYNIAIVDWNDFGLGTRLSSTTEPSLESLPHIMARLTENWGTPDGLAYINKLIEDNRGGQRLGFSMSMVRDILLLRDILRQTCLESPAPL